MNTKRLVCSIEDFLAAVPVMECHGMTENSRKIARKLLVDDKLQKEVAAEFGLQRAAVASIARRAYQHVLVARAVVAAHAAALNPPDTPVRNQVAQVFVGKKRDLAKLTALHTELTTAQ